METSSNCRARAWASILSPSEKHWGQREARWNPKGNPVMLRDAEEGSARSTPAYLAQLRHYTLLGQKGPRAFRSHPPCPQLVTGLNISRMTLRDSINIYIIKYKLKKNSVKNTMWNKCCGFFFFLCCCCCCCYFIHRSSHSFSDELQYFSVL